MEIRSLGGFDEAEEPAQDPILVERGHVVQGLPDGCGDVRPGVCIRIDGKSCLKQPHQFLGDVGVGSERVIDVSDREGRRHQAPVAAIRTQHHQLLVRQIGRDEQPME